MPNYPTLIPKTTTPTPETLPGEGFVQALSGFDQLLKAVLEASLLLGPALVSAQLASRANASRGCSIRLCADNSVV